MDDRTLNQVLEAAGLSTEPAGHGRKHILDSKGTRLFTGRAHDVWTWLRSSTIVTKTDCQNCGSHDGYIRSGSCGSHHRETRRVCSKCAERPEPGMTHCINGCHELRPYPRRYTKADLDDGPMQRHFAAWLHATDGGTATDYIAWIRERAKEFRWALRWPRSMPLPGEFTVYIQHYAGLCGSEECVAALSPLAKQRQQQLVQHDITADQMVHDATTKAAR